MRWEESASAPHPNLREKAPRELLEGTEKRDYKERGILFSVQSG